MVQRYAGRVTEGMERGIVMKPPHVVVATPTTLVDLLDSHTLPLGHLSTLILDEVDNLIYVFGRTTESILAHATLGARRWQQPQQQRRSEGVGVGGDGLGGSGDGSSGLFVARRGDTPRGGRPTKAEAKQEKVKTNDHSGVRGIILGPHMANVGLVACFVANGHA